MSNTFAKSKKTWDWGDYQKLGFGEGFVWSQLSKCRRYSYISSAPLCTYVWARFICQKTAFQICRYEISIWTITFVVIFRTFINPFLRFSRKLLSVVVFFWKRRDFSDISRLCQFAKVSTNTSKNSDIPTFEKLLIWQNCKFASSATRELSDVNHRHLIQKLIFPFLHPSTAKMETHVDDTWHLISENLSLNKLCSLCCLDRKFYDCIQLSRLGKHRFGFEFLALELADKIDDVEPLQKDFRRGKKIKMNLLIGKHYCLGSLQTQRTRALFLHPFLRMFSPN